MAKKSELTEAVENVVNETVEATKKTTRKVAAKAAKAVKAADEATKDTVKKTTTRRTRKAAEPATEVFVQYYGKQWTAAELVALIKETWEAEGKKPADLKDIKLYIKPEENGAYYVLNGEFNGFIAL